VSIAALISVACQPNSTKPGDASGALDTARPGGLRKGAALPQRV